MVKHTSSAAFNFMRTYVPVARILVSHHTRISFEAFRTHWNQICLRLYRYMLATCDVAQQQQLGTAYIP
jgi:hypothetical protein